MIGTDVGGVPDAIRHGQTGLVIPSGDLRALVDVLRSLCVDADLRTRLGSTAYRVAHEQYSKERVMSLWYQLYEGDPAEHALK